jgi:glyoxylase-like metal-dependent hydrolase (beta-lactamase superfamily II)
MCRIDYDDPKVVWCLADGDAEVAPGVSTVLTPGHTPGHQSFVVRVDESRGGGGFIFAADAADLTENITEELPIGGVIGCDPVDTVENIRRLKSLASRESLTLVPGHDPVVWPALSAELAVNDGLPGRPSP